MDDLREMSTNQLLKTLETIFTLSLHGLDEKEIAQRVGISNDVLMIMRNTIFSLNRAKFRDLDPNKRRLSQVLYWIEPKDLEALRIALELASPNFEHEAEHFFERQESKES
ncbi:MAG: hypothetical protein Q3962_03105 [Corynebacterium sp.]|nr:hypothetical protein [Corynebacterium sp.]